ncbi:6-N-hydroxylaminopurine resistance protein [Sphingomonadaceae bacterium]
MIQTFIDALLTGQPVPFRADGAMSTIGTRQPVQDKLRLTLRGFEGDRVGDPSVHGDADKAVHIYPAEHYPAWRDDFAQQGSESHPLLDRLGGFGENISARGMTEERVAIGDRFQIGAALVEISQGRQPCWKIDHLFGVKDMTASVIRTGRSGYYFRVIEEGNVEPDDQIIQTHGATHGWTVKRAFQLLIGGGHKMAGAQDALRELSDLESLAANWRRRARQLLDGMA